MTVHIRKTRADETREQELRDTEWQEPSLLEMPPAPAGFVLRWIRVMTPEGKDDANNISKKLAEGWTFVKHEELPAGYQHLAQRESGRYQGYVGVGDVALAKLPEGKAMARRAHYENKARALQEAVDSQLRKLDDSRMPVYNESRTRVGTGRTAKIES